MAQQPPSPPGGGYPPPPPGSPYYAQPPSGGAPAPDPYAADRALAEWATARGYALNATPDLRWYQGWTPFVFFPQPTRVGRELRATFGEASVWIAELFEADPVRQATGEDRHLAAFLASTKLGARAALRSRQGAGVVGDLSAGLSSLFGSRPAPGSVLGDPTLEGAFEVSAPSREEGARALPMPLRELLFKIGFRGILELRSGGMVYEAYDKKAFEPQSLDALITAIGQLYRATG